MANSSRTPSVTDEKGLAEYEENVMDIAAGRGHLATDEYGQALVEFDKAAESRLRLKIDLFIIPTVSLMYLFCFIDRANIGNAKLAGFEKDLGLEGLDYNIVLSIFFISYIVFEIPSNLMCKWIGPGWWLPGIEIGFGICSVATAFVNNIHEASGVRFLLGLFEAGLMPGIAYYLSRWYRRSELAFRLSLYIVMAPLAGAFGGLLASGILKLDSFGSLSSWRMIFAIEGIITICIGIISFFTLTDRPETALWLSQEEKDLAVARVKSERVATTELLDKFDTAKMMRGIFSPTTIITAFIYMLNNITVQGLGMFAPTIIKTIYPNAGVISNNYIRFLRYIMFLASEDPMIRYGATFLISSGSFAFGAFCAAHVSANVVSDTARSSAIGAMVMFGNIGGLISTWSYLPFDGPNYHIGNGLNLATSSTTLLLGAGLWVYMAWDNKRRDRVDVNAALAGLSQMQIQDLDWRHPGFRWRP
ncbi:Major facilitator superfamily domain general substrate transporter [Penicillium expansum]|nr:Major facilitator superfamily domain general substrate transporter [Penicillium expansum]